MENETRKQEVAVVKPQRAPIQNSSMGLVLNTFDDMYRYADVVAQSGLAPKSLNTPAKVLVALQTGAEIGLKYQQSLKSICVINGNATIWGDAALGLCLKSPLCHDVIETNTGTIGKDYVATCDVRRVGREPVVRTFSWAQAVKAGLSKKSGPWIQFPERMMQMKARGYALRDSLPDVLGGMYLQEELEGVEVEKSPYSSPDMPEIATREQEKQDKMIEATVVEASVVVDSFVGDDEPTIELPDEVEPTEPVTVASQFKYLFAIVKELLPDDVDDDMIKSVLMECAAFQFGGSSADYVAKKDLWTIEMMSKLHDSWAGTLPDPVLGKFGLSGGPFQGSE